MLAVAQTCRDWLYVGGVSVLPFSPPPSLDVAVSAESQEAEVRFRALYAFVVAASLRSRHDTRTAAPLVAYRVRNTSSGPTGRTKVARACVISFWHARSVGDVGTVHGRRGYVRDADQTHRPDMIPLQAIYWL